MKGALIHGVLLAVMLVYGYRTWTRDKTTEPNLGSVVLWDKTENDLVSIEYTADKKIVKLERRGEGEGYWWGLDTTIEKRPKPAEPAAAGSGSGSAAAGSGSGSAAAGSGSGSAAAGSGSGSAATPPKPVEEEEVKRTVHEFPLGDAGDKLIKNYLAARALRDLGVPTDAAKKDYKLVDAKTTLTIKFKDGERKFLVGGPVYGGSDRYVVDAQSGKAYVLSRDLISGLEVGEPSLHLTDPRGFDATKIDSVTIDASGKSKTLIRVQTGVEGQQVKTWGDAETKKPNQTIANFIDNANNLRPVEYATKTKVESLTPVMTLTYKDERGATLGTLSLYRGEKPGVVPEGQTLDPANPPKGETEYYIMTPRTRVPAIVRKDTAERAEQDVPTVFSGQVKSVDPKGNPFGNTPVPPVNPHGAPGGALSPHGALPPGMGSAAPGAPAAGSAATAPTPGAGSAATKPAPGAGSAATKPAPAAGSAAKPAPAASSATKPAPAPAAGSATKPAPAAGSAAAPAPTPAPAPAKPAEAKPAAGSAVP